MKLSKGYYSVIQYVPDLARAESVNIGVLLFVPERRFLDTCIVRDNSRIRHCFGVAGNELKQLNSFKRSFKDRVSVERLKLETVEQLAKFVDTRGNQIQLTEPRFVKVAESEKLLDELFEKLVGGTSKKKPRVSFEKKVRERFELAGISDRITDDVDVHVPILEHAITVPFGYQNGKFNLLQTVRFESEKPDTNFTRACKYSIEGKSLQESQSDRGELAFNVIGSFSSQSDESVGVVRRVLKENKVRLITESDLPNLIDEIRRTGKSFG